MSTRCIPTLGLGLLAFVQLQTVAAAEFCGSATPTEFRGPEVEDDLRDAKISPFEAVRWGERLPEVQHGGAWYLLISVAGANAEDIVAHCEASYGNRARKRFEEDLPRVLDDMGVEFTRRVDLRLRSLANGQVIEAPGVEMTAANRRAIWEAAARRDRPVDPGSDASDDGVVERIDRAHRKRPAADWEHFSEAPPAIDSDSLSREQAAEDLDQVEFWIEHRYAYRDLAGVDYRGALDAVRAGFGDEVGVAELGLQLGRVLALFGDGHTRVSGLRSFQPPGYLPFLITEVDGRFVAFEPDRSGFLVDTHPFITHLDGRPVEEWRELAGQLVAQGSSTFHDFHSLRAIREFAFLREWFGADPDAPLGIRLVDEVGRDPRELERPLAAQRPTYGQRIQGVTRKLENGIAYLRIPSMDDDPGLLRKNSSFLERSLDAPAWIVDVRGNGGGTRDLLRLVFPFTMEVNESAWVANVGSYRLGPGEVNNPRTGHLMDRFLFPLGSPFLREEHRRAVHDLARDFTPTWIPKPGDFSSWHYLVLSPEQSPNARSYPGPIVILQDGGCFSATDIFLAAFDDRPGVTRMGTPSGGGSGRSRRVTLEHSGLSLRFSSMASFRRDGRCFDGVGVEPHHVVHAAPENLIGRGDAQLDAALAFLDSALERK